MKNFAIAMALAFSVCLVTSGCDKAASSGDEVIKSQADESELKPQEGNLQKAPEM